jgi:hypothetical protein
MFSVDSKLINYDYLYRNNMTEQAGNLADKNEADDRGTGSQKAALG